jgi:hypothetical protein
LFCLEQQQACLSATALQTHKKSNKLYTLAMAVTSSYRPAFAPAVSSPLNPGRDASAPVSAPFKPTTPLHVRRRSKTGRKCTSVSPTQRLLRQKAADAWKAQLMSRQAARSEARKVQALAAQKVSPRRSLILSPDKTLILFPQALEARIQKILTAKPSSVKPPVLQAGNGNGPQPYAFHMPDVGFFTPTKVVLAMGRMRRAVPVAAAPSIASDNMVQVPMAA